MIPIPISTIPMARTISLLRSLPVKTIGSGSPAKPMSPVAEPSVSSEARMQGEGSWVPEFPRLFEYLLAPNPARL